jgi:hypothetical protein
MPACRQCGVVLSGPADLSALCASCREQQSLRLAQIAPVAPKDTNPDLGALDSMVQLTSAEVEGVRKFFKALKSGVYIKCVGCGKFKFDPETSVIVDGKVYCDECEPPVVSTTAPGGLLLPRKPTRQATQDQVDVTARIQEAISKGVMTHKDFADQMGLLADRINTASVSMSKVEQAMRKKP